MNIIKPLASLVAIGLSVNLLQAGLAQAANFTFTKIADNTTLIPGSSNLTFSSVNAPVIDNGTVAFVGSSSYQNGVAVSGIYTSAGGVLTKVVDTNTPVPFSNVNFSGFGYASSSELSIDKGNLAFFASGNKPNASGGTDVYGIYTVIGGTLNRVIDQSTILPGDNSNYTTTGVGSIRINGTDLAFIAGSNSNNTAIFTNMGGNLKRVVDKSTPLPEGGGNFENLSNPSLSNGVLVFANTTYPDGTINNPYSGIYSYTGGVLKKIVDPATIMLGNRTDITFSQPIIDGNNLAFSVTGNQLNAIDTIVGGKINVVADTNTPVPGGKGGKFYSFDKLSFDNGNVAFEGSDIVGYQTINPPPNCSSNCPPPLTVPEIQNGIYTTLGGGLSKVIAEGDILNGKTIASPYLEISSEMLSGNSIAFGAKFTDGSYAIYRTDLVQSVSEPTPVWGLLPAVGILLLWRRKNLS